ncbi:MAG: hypothetical protein QOJ99_324 [Bryobacterales bacterium]|jgi:hypothetical protein|nr:hypothetical protein [Bryobacterales bacterium]
MSDFVNALSSHRYRCRTAGKPSRSLADRSGTHKIASNAERQATAPFSESRMFPDDTPLPVKSGAYVAGTEFEYYPHVWDSQSTPEQGACSEVIKSACISGPRAACYLTPRLYVSQVTGK